MDSSEIEQHLDINIVRCGWVDGLGRKVMLRKRGLPEVNAHLQTVVTCDISRASRRLGRHLIGLINDGNDDEKFVFTDVSKVLLIPVFVKHYAKHSSPLSDACDAHTRGL